MIQKLVADGPMAQGLTMLALAVQSPVARQESDTTKVEKPLLAGLATALDLNKAKLSRYMALLAY